MGLIRLGDTSSRTKYQLALMHTVLEIINENNSKEGLTRDEIYDKLYDLGLKREKEPKKKKEESIGLLLKTLNWLKLVSDENGKPELTDQGKKVLEIADSKVEGNWNHLYVKTRLTPFHIVWLDSVLAWKIPDSATFEKKDDDYSPYCALIYKIILTNGNVEYDWINSWARNARFIYFGDNNNDVFKLDAHNKNINLHKFRKHINNEDLFWEFVDVVKNGNLEKFQALLDKIFNTLSQSARVVQIIYNLFVKLTNKKKPNRNSKIKLIVTENIKLFWEKLRVCKFDSLIYTVLEELTLSKDYFDIIKRWILELGLGVFDAKNNLKTSKDRIEVFRRIANYINFSNQGNDYSVNDLVTVIEKSEFFNGMDFSNKHHFDEGEKVPFTKEVCALVINKFEQSRLNKDWSPYYEELKKRKIGEGVSNATIIEYFVSLFFWNTLSENNDNVSSFLESCNTILDDKLLPLSHAPGGMPDFHIQTNDADYIIETTVIENEKNLHKNESESIVRHSIKIYETYQKQINLFLISPKRTENHDKLVNFFLKTYDHQTDFVPSDVIDYRCIEFSEIEDFFK